MTTTAESSFFADIDVFRWLGVILAMVGIVVSAYLAYAKLADTDVVCVEQGAIDCSGVQNSVYSEIAGVPISLLGLGAYITILVVLLLEDRLAPLIDYGPTLLFGITLFGTLYSGYLTYIEAFVLEKWCLWCVASALAMVGLFLTSVARLRRTLTIEE